MASSLMGSHYGIGVDVDQDALEIARRNFDKFDIDNVDLIYSDVQTLAINPGTIIALCFVPTVFKSFSSAEMQKLTLLL